MGFYDDMQTVLNGRKSVTENGAVAYATSGKKLLDFNFAVSAMRGMDEEEIQNLFCKAYAEDKMRALEYLFYLGDIREGIGERKAFKACLSFLASHCKNITEGIMDLIPHYNRWSSVLVLLDNPGTKDAALSLIGRQLARDLEDARNGKPISLCAKWMPSPNTSSKETRRLAKVIYTGLGLSEKYYRKTLSYLRAYLDVVEVKMSAKKWGSINYEAVPSKANLNYKEAFMRNDRERRLEYLASLIKGETKINAGVLQPHEICSRYMIDGAYMKDVDEDVVLEELWKALPDLLVENVLVVRDGSGSMTWPTFGGNTTALDVSNALAIYMAEHNTGEWKDKYITFSARPEIVDLSNCDSLYEKLDVSRRYCDCSNTNIYKTMDLILTTAVRNNIPEKDMPKMIVIISDMQFDGRAHSLNRSLFDDIAEEFEEAGYKLPRICFWNLSGDVDNTVPMQENDLGLILCSGFSVQLLKMFMSGSIDPYKVLLDTLDGERYELVRNAVRDLL